jgi:hypothetical protein
MMRTDLAGAQELYNKAVANGFTGTLSANGLATGSCPY